MNFLFHRVVCHCLNQVDEYRSSLVAIESRVDAVLGKYSNREDLLKDPEIDICRHLVQSCGDSFLRLEKYVNLNFMGFVKILKKHDKHLPNPCRAFYTARLHEQSWVRGDYSDVMVTMSRIYSKLRKDKVVEETDNAKQCFLRSTKKYWVHTEDVSAVKYIVLQHLPVFLQAGMSGESDAQLTTSIYVDNYAMELYKGRLEKSPGAIALRFRWYGTKPADTVYVERKTHREKWMGEMSLKERFTVKEPQVMDLLKGTFDVQAEVDRLRAKGKKEDDIAEYQQLATEIAQVIQSKQLFPTMRTQYMRTAFQIPFDASVRVSLDTNLTMINERTPETLSRERWYRDPSKKSIPPKDITRFPHAVLEIKLQLEDASQTPQWVTDLINSGKLLEVHKFSKFLHGSAVLLPEDVPAMPYWIDDVTLADSIIKSGSGYILDGAEDRQDNPMLPHDAQGNAKAKLLAIERGDYVPSVNVMRVSDMRNSFLPVVSENVNTSQVYQPPSVQNSSSKSNHSGSASPIVSISTASSPTNSAKIPTIPAVGQVQNRSAIVTSPETTTAAGINNTRTSFSAYNNTNPIHSAVANASPVRDMNKSHHDPSPNPRLSNRNATKKPIPEDHYYRMSDEDLESGRSSGLCDCWRKMCGLCAPGQHSDHQRNHLCSWADSVPMGKVNAQKVEPKIFFANERTFISWLNMAVFMSSMSIAVMAFAANGGSSLAFAFILTPMSILFIAYALNTYLVRGRKISAREAERWDDPYGPPILATLFALALFAIFIVKIVQIAT